MVIFKIANATLAGTREWIIATSLFEAFAVAVAVAYIVTTNLSPGGKGYLVINYISIFFSIIWLSSITRDTRKNALVAIFGGALPNLRNVSVEGHVQISCCPTYCPSCCPIDISSNRIRQLSAWTFFAVALAIFIYGMAAIASDILMGVLVEMILAVSTFTFVKTIQDRMDSRMWENMSTGV